MAFAQANQTGAQAQSGAQGQTGTQGQSGAQSGAHGQGDTHGNHKADHGMSTHQGAGTMVGKQDEQFLMKAAQGGLMELEVSRLAQEKASSQEIKDFARQLEQDHSAANSKLKELASQKNVDLPTDMGKHATQVDKLRNLSGDQFDRAWINMQVQHHKKDVNEFTKHSNRAMDSDVKTFASSTVPKLQEHLQKAQELQGQTRSRSADQGRSGSGNMNTNQGQDATGSQGTRGSQGNQGAGSSTQPQGANNPTSQK